MWPSNFLGSSHEPTVHVCISGISARFILIYNPAILDRSWDMSWKDSDARRINSYNLGVGKSSLLQNISIKEEIQFFFNGVAYLAIKPRKDFVSGFVKSTSSFSLPMFMFTRRDTCCTYPQIVSYQRKPSNVSRYKSRLYIRYAYKPKVTHPLTLILTVWVQYIISKGFTD